jgi:hypothetical protein
MAHTAQGIVAMIIGQDKEDVGLFLTCRERCGAGNLQDVSPG